MSGKKAKVPNITGVRSLNQLLTAVADTIDYLNEHEVPKSYWQERLRWFLEHDAKTKGTLRDKKALLDNIVREVTEAYVLDKEGIVEPN